MDNNPRRKLVVSAMTAVLLLSSILFLADVEADPNDLSIINLYEPDGTPPPRVDTDYFFVIEWENGGSVDEDATVRLYADCDRDSGSVYNESATFTMGAGETGIVNLSITFTVEGETCYSATIPGSSSDPFENFVNVEPQTGEADLFIELTMDQEQAAPGETIIVSFEYGNDGDVSSLNPVRLMAYFDPISNNYANYFEPSPFDFDYLSPPPADAPPEPEVMDWEFTIPEGTCDLGPKDSETLCENDGGVWTETDGRVHQFTVFIDSEEANTDEDTDLENNKDTYAICIGNCDQPDLAVAEEGLGEDSIMSQPLEAVAGRVISFTYGITNLGDGNAECPPAGPACPDETGELITHLEIQDCSADVPEGDDPCVDGNGDPTVWKYVNLSKVIKTPIQHCCEENTLYDDNVLKLNWSTTPDDAGTWNIRIFVDANNVVEETDENNNYLDWNKVHGDYFELIEQRPDLMISAIDTGVGTIYQGDTYNLQVQAVQSAFGDAMADNVEVHIRITEPKSDGSPGGIQKQWQKLSQNLTVGFAPDITFFDFDFTPSELGEYLIDAWIDKDDNILEWNEENNQLNQARNILVKKKLPDLQITNLELSPISEDGYAKVGVVSELTATITNNGVRNLDEIEQSKLAVTFYVESPFVSQLAKIYVDQALNVSDTIVVKIPVTLSLNENYVLSAIVDEDSDFVGCSSCLGDIEEVLETNNRRTLSLYAASLVDAYVTNLDVEVGDGLAGREHPVTFDLGMANLAVGPSYRLFFNVSVEGTFGYSETLALYSENSTGTYPLGTGYQVDGYFAYVDFNSSFMVSQVTFPWIPNKDRTDIYILSVEVSSDINVNETNDLAYVDKLSMERLTTNIQADSIKVTEKSGSATIKVTVSYPRGEQTQLDVMVGLEVYKASDYEEGNPPLDSLTPKNLTGLVKGDARSVSFTWAVKNGDYIFVAILDPDDLIKEVDENDNSFPSKLITFGESTGGELTEEEDDGGLLPAPSLVSSLVLLGSIAFFRRR